MRVHRVPARRASRSRRGAAAAEFAVVLPLLMTVVLGCVDFGRFAYNYIAVSNAARAAAGYGMMNTYDVTNPSTQTTWSNNIQQAAKDEMTGQTGFSASSLQVTVTTSTTGEVAPDLRIVVTATYPFSTIVTWPGIPSSLNLSRTVAMRKIR